MAMFCLTTRKSSLTIFLLMIASLFHLSVSTVDEGDALLTMMSSWGTTFPTWLPNVDPCSGGWENVSCSEGHVTQLNLTKRGLSGHISPEIGRLKELSQFDISNNNVTGNVPDSLENCEKLSWVDLSKNFWQIPFPVVITKLRNLEIFKADSPKTNSTGWTGEIPNGFYELRKMKIVFLGGNEMLKGDLKGFAKLSNLEELTVWKMVINSALAPEIGNLTKLRYFNCHTSGLTGSLPASFGELKALEQLDLHKNRLTGDIPSSWRRLLSMRNFRLGSNDLIGPFPDWIFKDMPFLSALYLSENQFYGAPPNISTLESKYNISGRLNILKWNCNYLDGMIPCNPNNTCSAATFNKTIKENEDDDEDFYFEKNCYTDETAKNISKVTKCGTHTLSCAAFANAVKEKKCPECPSGQNPIANSTFEFGCPCEVPVVLSGSGSDVPIGAVIGGVLGLVFVFTLILGFILWKRRKNFSFLDTFGNKEEVGFDQWDIPAGVEVFTVEELARVTSDFSDDHVIGQGGFGKVYFGTLGDGRQVAIKRASAGSVQGVHEFRNEVSLLSRLHHRHLVRLEGFCAEKGFQVLVYEFMSEGNLQDNLYGAKAKAGAPLSWYKRLEIAYSVAQGLDYLHCFADPPVIHRDIKPSNILLDEHLVAKVADFGISKESLHMNTHISTRPAGTPGFLDPEYFLKRHLTTASDVYAYGVVLLELITGQTAVDHKRLEEFNLIEWVKKRFPIGGVECIIDPAIENDYSEESYTLVTELALRCANFSRSERPSMKEVLTTLKTLIVRQAAATPNYEESDWLGKGKKLEMKDLIRMDSESYTHTKDNTVLNPSGYMSAAGLNPR